jgi:hypothetical protein
VGHHDRTGSAADGEQAGSGQGKRAATVSMSPGRPATFDIVILGYGHRNSSSWW